MPNLDDFTAMADSQGARSSVVSDCNQPLGPKKPNQFRQELFTGASLALVVSSIREWGICFVGVKRKHIPKEDARFDLGKYAPDHGCGPFGHRLTFGGPGNPNAPACGVRFHVNVVC
jgi:hypothetical protein